MEENVNEINKKLKINNNKVVNYYVNNASLKKKKQHSVNFTHSNKLNNSTKKGNNSYDVNITSKNCHTPNLMKGSLNYGEYNANSKNNNIGSITTNNHPFIKNGIILDADWEDKELKKKFDLYEHQKIFLKNNIKDRVEAYNSNKKLNNIGLSSNEYTNYNVVSEKNSYDHAKKINELWNIYVNELLELTNNNELSLETINEMELNGAYVEIHKSRCSSYIGIKGIILLETQNGFKIITPNSKVLILLKNKTVFIIKIKDKQYYLHGVQLMRDPALKSSKKYKMLQNRVI
ncbi:ribonuclease P protein subunit p29, putative [Plasmodium berghei]|uniref:Ribonuclease P protein subunit p29, putative n=2 Tax=Plasmodium berghei TaxID=5821 RepID=A0A509AKU1_PLABA|nr:ribonuclease P protein subunit p29, putative [Plasmodium berghei ANKA]CXI65474.1 ribonuclease P protein subunit p29, putative [Plasmodium berghei]SCM23956.1 ribonuclease P protein subunit p29, putative [Plasmodium berghei]SCN26856.1 ribonuclease P protein subunit p29, putative [Plasmodium berghei]SCO61245.1 ribonuclease P protein subunit p29, putative [Plasmodium berghei]SCO63276.1 ribonuclease P protein subunit p29, putative [Plasmodium berghei]|eukprot:XP_034422473.1 ribonuclease P protein subunit p29, putative [Plasmodium berghei ANKA]